MGASISQRPGKCLKSRRTKSEEYLEARRTSKDSMGRFSAPWHDIVTGSMLDNHQDYVNHSGIFECADWTDKDFSCSLEKSFTEIHRTDSLGKSSFQNNNDSPAMNDCTFHGIHCEDEALSSSKRRPDRKLRIDIEKDNIFEVELHKGIRGLGFSVLEYDGLIFIKQLFPLEAAFQCGALQEGDIILSANGNSLADLSSFEALRILRKLDSPVILIVCRLQQFSNKKSATSSQSYFNFAPSTNKNSQHEEFEVKMRKINGSLGFTLKKDEHGHQNHIVRALVKEPAISDGRIKPGDQIISVNEREICEMTHQEAVKFLRDCNDEVVLKLRRDNLSSSLTSLSSSHLDDNNRTLRKEAVDMLNTLAVKKIKVECENEQNSNAVDEETMLLSNSPHESGERFEGTSLSQVLGGDDDAVSELVRNEEVTDGPVSLPVFDVVDDKINFQHSEPAYRSINVPNFSKQNSEDTFNESRFFPSLILNNAGLLKWKGIVLEKENENSSRCADNLLEETLVVQLQRNWNSRLGFSLNNKNGITVISAIYPGSVAFKDGRLKIDDAVIEINGENVEQRETGEIIEMLRTVRGTVTVKVRRNNLKNL